VTRVTKVELAFLVLLEPQVTKEFLDHKVLRDCGVHLEHRVTLVPLAIQEMLATLVLKESQELWAEKEIADGGDLKVTEENWELPVAKVK